MRYSIYFLCISARACYISPMNNVHPLFQNILRIVQTPAIPAMTAEQFAKASRHISAPREAQVKARIQAESAKKR